MFGFLFGNKANTLNASEFAAKYNPKTDVILDVRTVGEFQGGHLKGAKNMDWLGGVFQAKAKKLNKNKTYYLYCASGNRSSQATNMMTDLGFENVHNIGGYGTVKNVL